MNNRFEIEIIENNIIEFDYGIGTGTIHTSHKDKFEIDGEYIIIKQQYVEKTCNGHYEEPIDIEEEPADTSFETNLLRLTMCANRAAHVTRPASKEQLVKLANIYTSENNQAPIDDILSYAEAQRQIDFDAEYHSHS